MTAVPRVTGSKLLVQIGDGASPETFAHDCLINTQRGIQFTSERNEVIMPDCDNPDDPAWKDVELDGFQATINGAGMLYAASIEDWWNWYVSGAAKNVRFNITATGYWEGAFKLPEFNPAAADSNKDTATCTVTLVSTGAVSFTAA